ncbi:MAG: hypothetical protein MUF49_00115 [Oculatellaceae cyanobacterium Prado106]|nr:hypothetical protein [Oculatellaceae cyanobacterium Prado106]
MLPNRKIIQQNMERDGRLLGLVGLSGWIESCDRWDGGYLRWSIIGAI